MKKCKVGFTAGVFDLLHVGHLNLLERCKEMCDYLIVGVCDDDYVRNVKRTDPMIPDSDRLRLVEALGCVDEAVLIDSCVTSDKMVAQSLFGFDVLFSGDDWRGSERYAKTEEQFQTIGVAIEYLPYTKGVSTSALKNQLTTKAK